MLADHYGYTFAFVITIVAQATATVGYSVLLPLVKIEPREEGGGSVGGTPKGKGKGKGKGRKGADHSRDQRDDGFDAPLLGEGGELDDFIEGEMEH
jgi:hypothetical protein